MVYLFSSSFLEEPHDSSQTGTQSKDRIMVNKDRHGTANVGRAGKNTCLCSGRQPLGANHGRWYVHGVGASARSSLLEATEMQKAQAVIVNRNDTELSTSAVREQYLVLVAAGDLGDRVPL